MNTLLSWYIVKCPSGNCKIIPTNEVLKEDERENTQKWGPFTSQEEAIVRRVGLIRAGKCQPV